MIRASRIFRNFRSANLSLTVRFGSKRGKAQNEQASASRCAARAVRTKQRLHGVGKGLKGMLDNPPRQRYYSAPVRHWGAPSREGWLDTRKFFHVSFSNRAVAALLRALAARDDAEADELAEAAAIAAVQAMRESWGMRLDAAATLLEAAEAALDRAEAAPFDSEERGREVALFELLMSAATV